MPRNKRIRKTRCHNLSIDDDIWKKAGPILKEIGYTRSRFVTLILTQIVQNADKGLFDTITQTFNSVITGARGSK